MNVSSPSAAGMVQSYKNAITAMLKLPPTDPRNWYRNSLTHLLDCPHGNWWFLPWHRGYLGWFEQTCRALSGDPYFALPYWDWTAEPSIPPVMADMSVLNPASPAYIDGFAAFQQQFTDPVNAYYAALTADQQGQLSIRGLATPADFWSSATGAFFPSGQARQPDFDAPVLNAVALATILDALSASTFVDFGSDPSQAHSQSAGFAVLEGQPHNNVHVAVGGYMSEFLSPIDPIFFLHHGNIDRLWDVWTRKQQAQGLPTLPDGPGLAAWQSEPFLFYTNASGQTVQAGKAGDYATIGNFNYSYQPGSGEQVVTPAPARLAGPRFKAETPEGAAGLQESSSASFTVPQDLTNPAAGTAARPLVARITVQPPENRRGVRLHVLVNPPQNLAARSLGFRDPSFAGSFAFFGTHSHGQGHMAGPVSVDIDLGPALAKLRAAGRLKEGEPLQIRVVPDSQGVRLAPVQAAVKSISVRTLS